MNFIALKMLLGDRLKYAGLLLGITFTSFLVTFATSYFGGMMTRSYALIAENSSTHVWVMDPAVMAVEPNFNLPASALKRVRSVEGVRSARVQCATKKPSNKLLAVAISTAAQLCKVHGAAQAVVQVAMPLGSIPRRAQAGSNT